MRKLLISLMIGGSMCVAAGAALAQGVDVRIETDRPSYRMERHLPPDLRRAAWVERRSGMVYPVASRRIVERRIVVPRRVRTVCRMEVRERIRPNGVVVRRPVEVCRRVVSGRRAFID